MRSVSALPGTSTGLGRERLGPQVEEQGPQTGPKPRRGANEATSMAVVKIARRTSDRRLARRRARSVTCQVARASTFRSLLRRRVPGRDSSAPSQDPGGTPMRVDCLTLWQTLPRRPRLRLVSVASGR
jgi:hypothetical protein